MSRGNEAIRTRIRFYGKLPRISLEKPDHYQLPASDCLPSEHLHDADMPRGARVAEANQQIASLARVFPTVPLVEPRIRRRRVQIVGCRRCWAVVQPCQTLLTRAPSRHSNRRAHMRPAVEPSSDLSNSVKKSKTTSPRHSRTETNSKRRLSRRPRTNFCKSLQKAA